MAPWDSNGIIKALMATISAKALELPPPNIYGEYLLDKDQYLQEHHPKDLIVLHHTVGGSAQSTYEWWNEGDKRRIGTAYIIERDGTIWEVFSPECWAYHLKMGDADTDRRSIGIELASEGGLTYKEGKLFAFDGRKELGREDYLVGIGAVVRLPAPYRGYNYFDAYDAPQVVATTHLVRWLCKEFGIPKEVPAEAPNPDGVAGRYVSFKGIIHHAMVRKDKSDLHPAFPWDQFLEGIGGKYV